MNKATTNLILCMVLFGATAAQGASLSSLWHKHGSTALWSLYTLGAAAATYACHKDVLAQIEKSEKVFMRDFSSKRCYEKPVELAVFFALMGGAVKFYGMYFK